MADTFGTIPTGDVWLGDGRVLLGLTRPPTTVATIWATLDGVLVVIAAYKSGPSSIYMHVSLHCSPEPTEQDITLVGQAFFGDMSVDYEQDAQVREAHPEKFDLRPVGWRPAS